MASTLKLTVAHAISYLTRPLAHAYPASTVIKLQLALEANLTALFAPTWLPSDLLHGSDNRSLTLSPDCLPPRAIYATCLTSGVQWFDWIALLGGRQFDLFVDPGCVSVRFAQKGSRSSQLVTVWSEGLSSSPTPQHIDDNSHRRLTLQPEFRASAQHPTLAQQLLADDREEDEELFAILADEISAPTWIPSSRERYPIPASSTSPLSISVHSRSSSRSSNSSSTFSFASSDSCGSATTVSTPSSSPTSKTDPNKRSRRERARQARVFVDPSKNQVTPYEGGKTTVLTGGVMLGAVPVPKVATRPAHIPVNYRVVRV
jgi:hypothetical protein